MPLKTPRESDLLVHKPVLGRLSEIQALVFDIDGVLLDVSQSFHRVVCETVQRFLTDHCRWQPDGPLLEPDEVILFKGAGGFNNDWDLTLAAVLYYLRKGQQYGTTDAVTLRAAPPALPEFLAQVRRAGGGLSAAEHLLMPTESPEQRRELTLLWNQKLIVQLFQERYAGEEHCRELYGFDPQHVHGRGALEQERVLLDASLLPARIQRYAVLTDRTLEEAELALERVGLLGRIPRRHLVCAEAPATKPDPTALLTAVRPLKVRVALYLGDTLDDLQMVEDYKKTRRDIDPEVFSCQVLSGITGKQERQLYLERGADLIAPDVNAVLRLLNAP